MRVLHHVLRVLASHACPQDAPTVLLDRANGGAGRTLSATGILQESGRMPTVALGLAKRERNPLSLDRMVGFRRGLNPPYFSITRASPVHGPICDRLRKVIDQPVGSLLACTRLDRRDTVLPLMAGLAGRVIDQAPARAAPTPGRSYRACAAGNTASPGRRARCRGHARAPAGPGPADPGAGVVSDQQGLNEFVRWQEGHNGSSGIRCAGFLLCGAGEVASGASRRGCGRRRVR
jgi:hypothetical protein